MFSGLFSTQLLALAKPRFAYFVDVWWTEFGETFPDWGAYTDFGRLGTHAAYEAAARRIRRAADADQAAIVVGDALSFLATLPDRHLDWVYLDTCHSYNENREILIALSFKLKRAGVLSGDDWCNDSSHPHYGETRALLDLMRQGRLELLEAPRHGQWLAQLA